MQIDEEKKQEANRAYLVGKRMVASNADFSIRDAFSAFLGKQGFDAENKRCLASLFKAVQGGDRGSGLHGSRKSSKGYRARPARPQAEIEKAKGECKVCGCKEWRLQVSGDMKGSVSFGSAQ